MGAATNRVQCRRCDRYRKAIYCCLTMATAMTPTLLALVFFAYGIEVPKRISRHDSLHENQISSGCQQVNVAGKLFMFGVHSYCIRG